MKKIAVFALAASGLAFVLSGCNTLQSIAVDTPPARTVYGQGQALELAGLSVSGVYKKGDVKPVYISPSHVSGYDRHRAGEQTVVITVNGLQTTFRVTVVPLLSIKMISPPSKLIYRQGEALSIAGLVIQAQWADPVGSGYYPPESLTVSGYNADLPGVQTVIISAEGRSASFTVDVKILQSIAIQVPPTKTLYKVGENLDLRGLVVEGTWEGMGSQVIAVTGSNISGYEKNKAGQQTVVVTAGGRTAVFRVITVPLSSIRIVASPVKSRYKRGEALELNGLEVWGTWEGIGSEKLSLTAENVTGYDAARIGQQPLTVRVGEKTAVFSVSVMGLSSLRIIGYPRITYTEGEALDLAGLSVLGTYTDTISSIDQNIPVTGANVSGYVPSRIGTQILTISVDGVSTTFPVTVSAAPPPSVNGPAESVTPSVPAKTMTYVTIDYRHVTKWVYAIGESFDINTVPVYAWYSDGSSAPLRFSEHKVSFSGYDSRAPGWKDVVINVDGMTTFPLRVTVAAANQ
ncbi:MAG: bacterial Ig-like domain-containing protein [Treponema sp.]|jgi:hypothetical protein|nr:bacterial Ig-like domain-containing protein [Treponema sp.]